MIPRAYPSSSTIIIFCAAEALSQVGGICQVFFSTLPNLMPACLLCSTYMRFLRRSSSSTIMKWQNCADYTTIRAKSQELFCKLPKLGQISGLLAQIRPNFDKFEEI